MIYTSRNLERISKNISEKIGDELDRIGVFYRIFYRCKTEESVKSKLSIKTYDGINSFLRDIIGIRVTLYFYDDINIVYPYFKKFFQAVEETVDLHKETEFKPTRVNLISKIPNDYSKEFRDIVVDNKVDDTFELQFRTVLSEGWHEVDHDLRYKCKSEWENSSDLGRMFNGVLASLEASDWTILQIFDKLSHRHYKDCHLESMIRAKFRIRLLNGTISKEIEDLIKGNSSLKRELFKIDRNKFLSAFLNSNVIIPININNLIFLLNAMFIKNEKLFAFMPNQLKEEFKDIL